MRKPEPVYDATKNSIPRGLGIGYVRGATPRSPKSTDTMTVPVPPPLPCGLAVSNRRIKMTFLDGLKFGFGFSIAAFLVLTAFALIHFAMGI
jgi:hypothetical protein